MNLIKEKLARVQKADYSHCNEVQAFIQELVDRDDLIAWSQREDAPVIMSLPERIEHNRLYKFLP